MTDNPKPDLVSVAADILIGALTRREFTRLENNHLGRFLDTDHLVGWRRDYRCDCGFHCHTPADLWDHAQTHNPATEDPAK